MSRFIRRSAMALPALLIAPVTAAALALPAQAATTWSAALPLPFGVGSQGFAENASGMQPGGTWSAPVNVSTDPFGGPVIGMDGSGNAIVAWTGGGKQIRTASLPAGGNWTAVDTLGPGG